MREARVGFRLYFPTIKWPGTGPITGSSRRAGGGHSRPALDEPLHCSRRIGSHPPYTCSCRRPLDGGTGTCCGKGAPTPSTIRPRRRCCCGCGSSSVRGGGGPLRVDAVGGVAVVPGDVPTPCLMKCGRYIWLFVGQLGLHLHIANMSFDSVGK